MYPFRASKNDKLLNSSNIPIHPRVKDIYNYLLSNGKIKDLKYNKDILGIFSKDVLKKIRNCNDNSWEEAVPMGVAKLIKERLLFEYSCDI